MTSSTIDVAYTLTSACAFISTSPLASILFAIINVSPYLNLNVTCVDVVSYVVTFSLSVLQCLALVTVATRCITIWSIESRCIDVATRCIKSHIVQHVARQPEIISNFIHFPLPNSFLPLSPSHISLPGDSAPSPSDRTVLPGPSYRSASAGSCHHLSVTHADVQLNLKSNR